MAIISTLSEAVTISRLNSQNFCPLGMIDYTEDRPLIVSNSNQFFKMEQVLAQRLNPSTQPLTLKADTRVETFSRMEPS